MASNNSFVEENISTDSVSALVDGGEVKLAFHSSMATSATNKNSGKITKMSRVLPNFSNGAGFWFLKYPYERQVEQPVEGSVSEVVMVGGKRKSSSSGEVAEKKTKTATRVVKSSSTQSTPLTLKMAHACFVKSNVELVRDTIKQAVGLQAEDDLKNRIVKRSKFIPLTAFKSNGKTIEFGMNITNHSIVRARASGENAFEGEPRMLAQLMVKDRESNDKTAPITQFALTVEEMMKVLTCKEMAELVEKHYSTEAEKEGEDQETKEEEAESDEEEDESEEESAGDEEDAEASSQQPI
jgi:hypothetical protein